MASNSGADSAYDPHGPSTIEWIPGSLSGMEIKSDIHRDLKACCQALGKWTNESKLLVARGDFMVMKGQLTNDVQGTREWKAFVQEAEWEVIAEGEPTGQLDFNEAARNLQKSIQKLTKPALTSSK